MPTRLVRSAVVAIAVTSPFAWTQAASAQSSEPAASYSASPAETSAAETGSVEITVQDTAGDAIPGAAIVLLDSTGQEAGQGTTDTQGNVSVPDLAPGVYRLKQTSPGSPLHEAAPDQDVIVTPGATTHLTITNSFKTAEILLQAKDDKTGKVLSGATVNIGTGTSTLLTLTTGADGTASGALPMTSRTAQVRITETKAPHGYGLDTQTRTVTAVPGTSVTVTLTHTRTAGDPTNKPTHTPTSAPATASGTTTTSDDEADPSPQSGTGTPDAATASAAAPVGHAAPEVTAGSLAHTGADATPWLIGGTGVLILAGTGALLAARRSLGNSTDDRFATS